MKNEKNKKIATVETTVVIFLYKKPSMQEDV
jgi:hypothetical protein